MVMMLLISSALMVTITCKAMVGVISTKSKETVEIQSSITLIKEKKEQDFDDISTALETTNKSLELRAEGFGTVVTFLRWFEHETYRHATVRTSGGVTALLPNSIAEMSSMNNKLKATEIFLDQQDCDDGLKTYDLNEKRFHGVLRFTAKSDLCSYKVIDNDENNYIDPGPENPHKYQYLEGGKDQILM